MKNCIYCGKDTEFISVVNDPICLDCMFESKEYAKNFTKNDNTIVNKGV